MNSPDIDVEVEDKPRIPKRMSHKRSIQFMHDNNIQMGIKKRMTVSERYLLTESLKSSEVENKSNREEIKSLRLQMQVQADKMTRILDLQIETAERLAALQPGYKEPPNVWQRNDLYDGIEDNVEENTFEHFDDDVMSAEYYDHSESTPFIDTTEVNNTLAAARSAANHAANRGYTSSGSIATVESSRSRDNGENT